MEKYRVRFKKSVTKDFRAIPNSDVKKILLKIATLAENPRREGAVKLSNSNVYRIRQGQYRIVYEIRDSELVVMVIKVGHRSNVYQRM